MQNPPRFNKDKPSFKVMLINGKEVSHGWHIPIIERISLQKWQKLRHDKKLVRIESGVMAFYQVLGK